MKKLLFVFLVFLGGVLPAAGGGNQGHEEEGRCPIDCTSRDLKAHVERALQ